MLSENGKVAKVPQGTSCNRSCKRASFDIHFFFCALVIAFNCPRVLECASGEFAGASQLEGRHFTKVLSQMAVVWMGTRSICRADLYAYIKLAKKKIKIPAKFGT